MRHLFLLIFLATSSITFSQIKLESLKERVQNANLPINKTKVKDLLIDKFLESQKEYNQAVFNYAISFSDNAGLFEVNERFEKQKLILNQVRKSRMDDDDITAEERADDLNKTGEIFYANNKFKSAELCFFGAMKFYEEDKLEESEKYATTLSNMALLYHTSGRMSKASSTMEELMNLRLKLDTTKIGYGVALNNQAVLFKDLGRYNKADLLFKRSQSIISKEKGTESLDFAISINNQAMLYQTLGRYDLASKMLKEALGIVLTSEGEKSVEYIKLQINLALIYRDKGELALAEQMYNQAIKNKKKRLGAGHPDYAMLLLGLASVNLEMEKYENVEDLLLKATTILENKLGDEHPTYASAINDLGNFYRTQEKYDEATPLINKSLKIRKEKLGEKHPEYINSLEDAAILEWSKGNILSAKYKYKEVIKLTLGFIDDFFGPMSEVEKTKFWDKFHPRFYRFFAFSSENQKEHPELLEEMFNVRLKTKALIMVSYKRVLESILNSNNQSLIDKYHEWIDGKEELAKLYTYTKEELEKEEIDLSKIEQNVNNLEREISNQSNAFTEGFLNKQRYDYDLFKKNLSSNEALVEIVEYIGFHNTFLDKMNYSFFILTQDKVEYITLENGKDLNSKYLNFYRNTIRSKIVSKTPYLKYWLPVEEKTGKKSKVYVTLDGVYSQINLNSLFDGEKYLLEKHEFTFLNHSKDFLKLKKSNSNRFKNASLMGNPQYNSNKITALPGTAVEISRINALLKKGYLKVNIYKEGDATEENFKNAKNEIIHVATHGFFMKDIDPASKDRIFGIQTAKANENPLHRSGLLLTGAGDSYENNFSDHNTNNGVLTAYEIKNLDLSKVNLAVLSACETGLGDVKVGEGVYGMQRALQEAGVSKVIMSLWKVDDKATSELMVAFYKNLIINKMSVQTSYRNAMLELKKKFPEPYYWGAFILVNS